METDGSGPRPAVSESENFLHKIVFQILFFVTRQRVVRDQRDSSVPELRQYLFIQTTRLLLDEKENSLSCLRQLLRRSQTIGRNDMTVPQSFLESGDANHEELVEV